MAAPEISHLTTHQPERVENRGEMRWSLLLRGPGRVRRASGLAATACFVAGGVLVLCSAYVHFHLWGETDGYRSIPTIGPLFLVQSIAGLVVGVGVIAVRRVWAALIGAGFGVATVAGFLISVAYGLFGFKESWLAPYAKEAFLIELVAVVVLLTAAALCLVPSAPHTHAGRSPSGDPA